MACACRGRTSEQYLWYDPTNEGAEPMAYKTEVEAKAKVFRKGGVYTVYNPNLTLGQNVVAAEQTRVSLTG